MKNFCKKFGSLLLAVIGIFTFTACGNNNDDNNKLPGDVTVSEWTDESVTGTLGIRVWKGGFGTLWLENVAAGFKKHYPNVNVSVKPTEERKQIYSEIISGVESKYDLFFSEAVLKEQSSHLLDLSDVYDYKWEGEDRKISEKLNSTMINVCTVNGTQYMIPSYGGALLIANKLYKNKKINLMAVTHCVNRVLGGNAIKKINGYYNHADIPVGVAERYAIDVDRLYEDFYQKLQYRKDFKGFLFKPSFYRLLDVIVDQKENIIENFESAYSLIIKKLKEAENGSVTLVCIGQMNNLADLIKNNIELLKEKINRIVVMCGNFQQSGEYYDDGETLWYGEFNIILDKESAKNVFAEKDLPLDIIDYNVGCNILTGSGLIGQEDNPVYKMYKLHGKGKECPSWDPIALLCASELYKDCFTVSGYGTVSVSDKGKTTFTEGEGKHRLISVKENKKEHLREVINGIYKE